MISMNKMTKLACAVSISSASAAALAFEPQSINTAMGIDFTPTISISATADDNDVSEKSAADTVAEFFINPEVKAELSTASTDFYGDLSVFFSNKFLETQDEAFLTTFNSELGLDTFISEDETIGIAINNDIERQDNIFFKSAIDANYGYSLPIFNRDSQFKLGLKSSFKYFLDDRDTTNVNDVVNYQFYSDLSAGFSGLGKLTHKAKFSVDSYTNDHDKDASNLSTSIAVSLDELFSTLKFNAEVGIHGLDSNVIGKERVIGTEASADLQWTPNSFLDMNAGIETDLSLGEFGADYIRTVTATSGVEYSFSDFLSASLDNEMSLDIFMETDSPRNDHYINSRFGMVYSPLSWLEFSGFYQVDVQEPMSDTERFVENEVGVTLKAGL
jgi:hypothetical protein